MAQDESALALPASSLAALLLWVAFLTCADFASVQ